MNILKSYNFVIFIVLLYISNINRVNANLNSNVGVVEGYYWAESDAVNGQYGQYSFSQRQLLIQQLADNGLGFYWYCPQPPVNTLALWNSTVLSQWTQTGTLGNQLGVKIVYGLRPGWLSTDFSSLKTKLQQVQSAGINYYSLNFDDAEGVATVEQQQREVSLANYLRQQLPTMTLWGLTPYAYYQGYSGSMTQWVNDLTIINTVNSSIPFIVTGSVITPSAMTTSQFPTLNGSRHYLFWDNWIAEDTSTRIPWGMINGGGSGGRVEAVLFQSPNGYILNLCFPLERIIQHLYCAGVLASGGSTCSLKTAGQKWANFLNSNGFLHGNQTVTSVATALETAMNNDVQYKTISEMESANPGLAGIFSTPPSTSTTSSTTGDTSTSTTGTSTSTTGGSSTSTTGGSSTSTTGDNIATKQSICLYSIYLSIVIIYLII